MSCSRWPGRLGMPRYNHRGIVNDIAPLSSCLLRDPTGVLPTSNERAGSLRPDRRYCCQSSDFMLVTTNRDEQVAPVAAATMMAGGADQLHRHTGVDRLHDGLGSAGADRCASMRIADCWSPDMAEDCSSALSLTRVTGVMVVSSG